MLKAASEVGKGKKVRAEGGRKGRVLAGVVADVREDREGGKAASGKAAEGRREASVGDA